MCEQEKLMLTPFTVNSPCYTIGIGANRAEVLSGALLGVLCTLHGGIGVRWRHEGCLAGCFTACGQSTHSHEGVTLAFSKSDEVALVRQGSSDSQDQTRFARSYEVRLSDDVRSFDEVRLSYEVRLSDDCRRQKLLTNVQTPLKTT
uniref:Uncharacterized protein n=1 Tax=Asparagus officinalis TaxID=4686 RepID=Q2XNZ4_ASPOF|nr:hypothetical protein 10.t00012 [Asparagus officinalis]